MGNKEIMSICKSCGHEILWRYNHWEHRKSHKQGIKENSRLPKPDILSNYCAECDEVGKKCCNPEPKEVE